VTGSRSITALGWSSIDVAGRQGIQFVVTLILARLLSPAEFGLLAMLSLFIALATSVVDSGFGSALIQRRQITEADKSSVFLFNAAMGALVALSIFSAAPLIARFYRQPILLPLTRLMALNLFIGSFGVVQVALLTRDLDFRTPCKTGIIAMIASGATAVWMAWSGYGVWSLAVQSVIYTSVSTGLIWVFCPWTPSLRLRIQSLRSLFGFGSRLLASGLLGTFFDRIQLTVIGKAFSAVDLGYYTRAYSTEQFPAALMSAVVSRVTFPVFAQRSHDPQAFKLCVRRAVISLMIPMLPMMVGLAVLARPLVLVLFGEKWLPCVRYLQALSVVGAFWPLHIINLNVLTALGRSDLFLRLEVVKRILTGLGLLVTFRVSVMAVVWAVLIVSVICVFVNTYYTKSLIGYGLLSQLRDLAPYFGISVFTGATAWVVGLALPNSPALYVGSAALIGAVLYCTLCWVLRLEEYRSTLASGLAVFHLVFRPRHNLVP